MPGPSSRLAAQLGQPLEEPALLASTRSRGVVTWTVTNRSPRPRRWTFGTPLPFSFKTVPESVPASTLTGSAPVEPLDRELRAERRLRDRHVEHREQVLAAALEPVGLLDLEPDEQVARRLRPPRRRCPTPPMRSSIPSDTPAGISAVTVAA